MQKIDIFAPNVRHGGGSILLKQLIVSLVDENLIGKVYVSESLKQSLPLNSNIKYNKDTFFSRIIAEIKLHRQATKDSKILFFGNLPPFKKISSQTYLYLHNILLISKNQNYKLPVKTKIRIVLEKVYLRLFIKNVTTIFVQTPEMVKKLNSFKKDLSIKLKPFIEHDHITESYKTKEYDFIYPSYAYPYKNHRLLLNTWINLAAVNSYPKLCLMLDSSLDRKTIDKFYQAKKKHKIIVDIYFNLSNEEVLNFYKKTKALVWPSFNESFGMPILEAFYTGIPIVAANLEYINDMLDRAYLFDPNSEKDLQDKIELFLNHYNQGSTLSPILKLKIISAKEFIKSM